MKEIKYNKIALILVSLIGLFILINPPFVLSVYVPMLIRQLLSLLIVLFSVLSVLKKKYFIVYYLPFFLFFIVSFFYWIFIGAVFVETVSLLFYIILAIALLTSVRRNKSLKSLLIDFYFFLILILSVLSIMSFLAYNLELVPYEFKVVGEDLNLYRYYHNYILGYIDPKGFESGAIGRVCGFMFEPGFQGWFLSTNFFIVSKFVKNKKYLVFVQLVVLLGALSSFSTMSFIVFIIVFASMLGYKLMSILGLKEKTANLLYVLALVIGLITVFTVVDQDKLLETLGPSSSEERVNRAEASFLYLVTSSPVELILGRGPGFITKKNGSKGESNQIIKSLVENGIVTTVIVLVFIVYCTRQYKFYMIANLLWLNSITVLFTPLFIVNILICKWLAEREKLLNYE